LVGNNTFQKRSRFAIKTVELCDNKTGYLWNFIVYTGKSADQVVSDLLSFSRVVMDLLMGLLGKGYCLVTDNYNTCHVLYKKLLEQKTDAYGTVRLGRKLLEMACCCFEESKTEESRV